MSAAPSDEPTVERRRWRGGILHRRSAVLLFVGAGAFGLFDPPAQGAGAPSGGTTLTRRYHPPVMTGAGVQLGPSTRITKLP
jgi:hypothetical protein